MVHVDSQGYTQRFYRARPTAVPVYSAKTAPTTASSPTTSTTPKANDSRGRVAPSYREPSASTPDGTDSPGSKTWTSRERIKAAACLSLSHDGRYLAVGETGYAPRVLIFSLQDASSDTPLVSISEHSFGVRAVAWSPDSRYLASLGTANDGFLYVWKIDARTGAARLFQQNRCTSYVRDMVWVGNSLVTLGVRHAKLWKIEEAAISPTKQKFLTELSAPSSPTSQKALPGRNILLGPLLDATFSCAAIDGKNLILCSEAGDVCVLDDDEKQVKLLSVLTLGFPITSIAIRNGVAYVGGKSKLATLSVCGILDGRPSSVLGTSEAAAGLIALGFLTNNLVTISGKRSIDVWRSDYLPGQETEAIAHIPMVGNGDTINGIQPLRKPNAVDASFMTWSGSGNVTFWDLEGRARSCVTVPIEKMDVDDDLEPRNQLTCARTSRDGTLLATADRQGVLKVTNIISNKLVLDTKAHSAECTNISLFDQGSAFIMACCGRDRTVQLFHRPSTGNVEHFQTLEFSSKVVQVMVPSEDKLISCSMDRTVQIFDLLTRDGEPDVIAAIPSRVISLKASPTSMTVSPDNKLLHVSHLDRSVGQFDITTGRQVGWYKCTDERGVEAAVLDSLSTGHWLSKDMDFLLATSNTDKSIRLYEANSGNLLDREWGHTEAINGVAVVEDDDESRKIVSIGSDGTIMIWTLDLNYASPRSMSRDPSPAKEVRATRPALRRVLSKAELAEFQRPHQNQNPAGRRSPPRTLQRRTSRINLPASANSNTKTPTSAFQTSPGNSFVAEDTPSRRPSVPADSRQASPPASPRSRLNRRPSMPALGATARKKSSTPNLRGFGSLNMSTEQACRTLRAYRQKLSSAEPISAEVLEELDQELRLTAAALGDRAIRSKAMNETVLSGLLDQYSERLVALLDEKMRLNYQPKERETASPVEDRRGSASGETTSSSSLSS